MQLCVLPQIVFILLACYLTFDRLAQCHYCTIKPQPTNQSTFDRDFDRWTSSNAQTILYII